MWWWMVVRRLDGEERRSGFFFARNLERKIEMRKKGRNMEYIGSGVIKEINHSLIFLIS